MTVVEISRQFCVEHELRNALFVAAEQKVGPDRKKQEIQVEWWIKLAKIRSISRSPQKR